MKEHTTFSVSQDAADLGLQPSVALIDDVVAPAATPDFVLLEARRLISIITSDMKGYLQRLEALGYNELFCRLGYDNQIPADERLAPSLIQKGFCLCGAVIDTVNVVALEHVAGIGLHDASKIAGDPVIARASGTEKDCPNFQANSCQT